MVADQQLNSKRKTNRNGQTDTFSLMQDYGDVGQPKSIPQSPATFFHAGLYQGALRILFYLLCAILTKIPMILKLKRVFSIIVEEVLANYIENRN